MSGVISEIPHTYRNNAAAVMKAAAGWAYSGLAAVFAYGIMGATHHTAPQSIALTGLSASPLLLGYTTYKQPDLLPTG
jgi:hypothetical protein